MSSIIETIKAKVDIADEVGMVVALAKSGKSLKGLCPFHNERSPSFYVFKDTQSWHCFGCNEGGDIFTFVQKQQNLDFHEALTYLAEKADISLEEMGGERTEEEREIGATKERLRKLNEDALLWFHQMLLRSREGSEARAYVQSRGITSDSVVAFSLGYAGEQWEGLTRYLQGQGYSEQELVTAGLARWRESEDLGGERRGAYDYFRNRLIFPIRDIRGRVIGFGGRALGENKPKYLNTPQTVLFDKGSILYGMDMAKDAIKQIGQVVIVEGYVDAVIAQQYGTKQTVACCGSAITEKHIQQLKKLTKQVTLALDPDAAGTAATEQGIKEALKGFDKTYVPVPLAGGNNAGFAGSRKGQQSQQGFQKGPNNQSNQKNVERYAKTQGIIRLEEQVDAEINVLQLPAGEDPDEVIRRDYSTWLYAVTHPIALIDYYFIVKTTDLNMQEPSGKTEAARRLLPVIGMISDRIKRDAYIRKLAGLVKVEERALYEELQRVLRGQKSNIITADFSGRSRQDAQGHPQEQVSKQGQSETKHRKGEIDDEDPFVSQPQKDRSVANKLSNEKNVSFGLDRREKSTLKWEDYLIGLLLQNSSLYQYVCGIITEGDFAGTDTRELYHILNSTYQRDSSPSNQSIEQSVPSALVPTVTRVLESARALSPQDVDALAKEAVQCAIRLKKTRLLQLNTELKFLLQEAAATGDKTAERQFLQQFVEIQRQLHTLTSATKLQG
ncbi:DNA primase [Ktedonobacteria bacterium brp13]|nr:DNA primase [Ktedonobacteria bacterium brp13]